MAKTNKDDLKIGVTFTPCKDCDRIEVVRCAKCVHYGADREKGGFCKRTASPSMWRNDEAPLLPDDFCSYGERRD